MGGGEPHQRTGRAFHLRRLRAGGHVRGLAAGFERRVGVFEWTGDGRWVYARATYSDEEGRRNAVGSVARERNPWRRRCESTRPGSVCWLAEHINDQAQLARQGGPLESSVGLTTPLKPIANAHDIGSFPQPKTERPAVVEQESIASAPTIDAPTTIDSMPGLKPKPVRPTVG